MVLRAFTYIRYFLQNDCDAIYFRCIELYILYILYTHGFRGLQGDSGGPLFRRIGQLYELVGVTSYGMNM